MSDGDEDAAAQRVAEQARLRKARREAKIKAGGSSRLSKLTGVNGSFRGEQPDDAAPAPEPTASQPAQAVPSPESGASEHFYKPARRPGVESRDTEPQMGDANAFANDMLSQMMLAGMRGTPPGGDGATQDPMEAAAEDPFMKMLLAQLGGAGGPGGPGGPGGAAGAEGPNPFAAMMEQVQAQAKAGPPAAAAENKYAYLWRVVHALFALGLGIAIAFSTTFSFTSFDREQAALASARSADADWAGEQDENDTAERELVAKVFWGWAASEAALLVGRFLLVDNEGSGGGMVAMATGVLGAFLPPVVTGTVKVVMRYSRWILAIRQDLAVVVFVLGICAWLRSGV